MPHAEARCTDVAVAACVHTHVLEPRIPSPSDMLAWYGLPFRASVAPHVVRTLGGSGVPASPSATANELRLSHAIARTPARRRRRESKACDRPQSPCHVDGWHASSQHKGCQTPAPGAHNHPPPPTPPRRGAPHPLRSLTQPWRGARAPSMPRITARRKRAHNA